MALESFYGGRQGVSPVIKTRFEFITKKDEAYQAKLNTENQILTDWEKHILKHYNKFSEEWKVENEDKYIMPIWTSEFLDLFVMDEQFKKVDYTDVWYDELCIIDTPNKMNPNNGKIFKRTLKRYQNPPLTGISDERALYAEYVGQIVGPSGGVPNLVFGNLDDVRKDAAGRYIYNGNEKYYNVENWDYLYPDATANDAKITSKNIEGTLPENRPIKSQYLSENSEEDYLDTDTREDDYRKIAILNSGDNNNITIVPGKNENNDFNDNIRYTWCNVRRNLNHAFHDIAHPDYEDEAWIYLGFEIPYTFWDVSATHIPYWLNTQQAGNIVDIQKLNETDEGDDHPFYHNLHFYIPRGTRGIGPEEIRLVKTITINYNNEDIQVIDNHPMKEDANGNYIEIEKDNKKYYKQSPTEQQTTTNKYSKKPLYNIKAITYNATEDTYSLNENNQNKITPSEKSYWIAKWTLYNPEQQAFGKWSESEDDIIYNANANHAEVTNINFENSVEAGDQSDYTECWIYLGSYREIASIRYEDNTGTINVTYSDTLTETQIPGVIDYAKTLRVEIDKDSENYGKVYKVSNVSNKNKTSLSDRTKVEKPTGDTLPLIKSVKTDDNGTITFGYSTNNPNEDLEIIADGKIREIVDFSTNNGDLLIHFNEEIPGKDLADYDEENEHYIYNFGKIYANTLTGMNNIYFGEEKIINNIPTYTQENPSQSATNVTVTFFKSSDSNGNDNLIEIWKNPSNDSNGS